MNEFQHTVKEPVTLNGVGLHTGESVELAGKYVPHFKPGKDMRERVNQSMALNS